MLDYNPAELLSCKYPNVLPEISMTGLTNLVSLTAQNSSSGNRSIDQSNSTTSNPIQNALRSNAEREILHGLTRDLRPSQPPRTQSGGLRPRRDLTQVMEQLKHMHSTKTIEEKLSPGAKRIFQQFRNPARRDHGPVNVHVVLPADNVYKNMSSTERKEFKKNWKKSFMETHGNSLTRQFKESIAPGNETQLRILFHFGYRHYVPDIRNARSDERGPGLGFHSRKPTGQKKHEERVKMEAGLAEHISQQKAKRGDTFDITTRDKVMMVVDADVLGMQGMAHRGGTVGVFSMDNPRVFGHEFFHTLGVPDKNRWIGGDIMSNGFFASSEPSEETRGEVRKYLHLDR